jgi:hypothetical protein
MNNCLNCGAPCRRKWCSQACNAVSRKKGREVECENCGTLFYLRPAYERKGGGRFCGDSCRRQFMSENASTYERIGGIYTHRRVAEIKLGRPLRPGEVIHHRDGNKRNNAPDNIRVYVSHSEHMKDEARNGRVGFTHDQAVAAGKARWRKAA